MKLPKMLLSGIVVVILAAFFSAPAWPASVYSISRDDAVLRIIDSTTGLTIDASVTITLAGESVTGGTGLTRNPLTGALFGLLKLGVDPDIQFGRELVTINPSTGVATSIGDTGNKFAGITFDPAGTLYGVTGDGTNELGAGLSNPATLFTLSTIDATPTLVLALGSDGEDKDGEAIGFNPDDGLIYHASGLQSPNVDTIFETINPDPGNLTITNIPLSGAEYEEALALLYAGSGNFLLTDFGEEFFNVTTGGVVSAIGEMDHISKGLAFVPLPPAVWLFGFGLVSLFAFVRRRTSA